jgi:cytidylate kinase
LRRREPGSLTNAGRPGKFRLTYHRTRWAVIYISPSISQDRRESMAIIMISRGTFSGGKALAECLADRLGYPCLSREEAVHEAVKRYGIKEKDLTAAMDELPPFWRQVHGTRLAYLRFFAAILLEHVREENLVYHGHVAHLILGSVSHILRVRVIADMEFRIKGAMERKCLSREEAIAFIGNIDNKRDKWTRFLYGIEWHDATLYDVLFNLERINIDVACEAVVHMAAMDVFKSTPQSCRDLDNRILGNKVHIALAGNDQTKAARVTVTADEGTVTITGGAPSTKVITAIADVAQKVEGVTGVKTEVGVGSDWYW